MKAALVMFKSDGERRDFPLTQSRTVIGRKPTCDLRVPLSSVSRQHCEITMTDHGLVCRDLGSSNGTFHNGDRLTEAELEPGDRLDIGPVHFIVTINGKPEDIQPVKTVVGGPDSSGAGGDVGKTSDRPTAPTPQPIAASDDDDAEDALTMALNEELDSPTTDIDLADDEDPIAALEALASSDEEDDEKTSSGG